MVKANQYITWAAISKHQYEWFIFLWAATQFLRFEADLYILESWIEVAYLIIDVGTYFK